MTRRSEGVNWEVERAGRKRRCRAERKRRQLDVTKQAKSRNSQLDGFEPDSIHTKPSAHSPSYPGLPCAEVRTSGRNTAEETSNEVSVLVRWMNRSREAEEARRTEAWACL